jgi:tetratricopeptide (TPR) repeat protein
VDRVRALSELGRTAQRAFDLDPGSAEANYRLGNFLYRKGRIQEAFDYRRKAIALSPDDPLMLSVRAGMEMERGHHENAVDLQRQAVMRDPLAPVYRVNLVEMLMLAGRLSEADSELRALSALLGTDRPDIHESYARLRLLQGRFEEALVHVGQSSSGGERDLLEVLAFDGLGHEAEASSSLERLRGREDRTTPLRLAIVQARRGNHDAAFELLEQSAASVAELPGAASTDWAYQLWIRMQHSPFLQPLHDDPRWGAWLERARKTPPPP